VKQAIALARGFLILLGCWGAGELVSRSLSLPVPGSVLGMLLLAAGLRTRLLRLAWVQGAAELMIRYMALFFVPPGVAVILYLELMREEWLALVAGSVASTLAVLLTVGVLQQRLELDDE
jgi:holin-like protein